MERVKNWLFDESIVIKLLLPALLVLAVIYSLWAASVGWFVSPMQVHSFRQTQTALVAWMIAQGGPFLKYENPTLGPPWSIPFEFPLYQALSAWLHMLTGWSIEVSARTIGKVFFYLSAPALYRIARNLGMSREHALIPVLLFLVSPIYLYWSRSIMIESTALFFALAYLAALSSWVGTQSKGALALAVAFGVFAALVKTTTYFGFAVAGGLWVLHKIARDRRLDVGYLIGGGVALLTPFLAGVVWTKFADGVKAQNPLADFITSSALMKWNFGTLEQRLGKDLWAMFFRITIHDAIGHRTMWMLSLAAAFWCGRRAWLYFLCSALFLLVPLVFTNLHIVHNYYANANAIFLIFAVAWLLHVMLSDMDIWKRRVGVLLMVAAVVFSVREFMRQPYYMQQIADPSAQAFGERIKSLVPENDVILVFGWDWDSTLAFFSKRRAVMARHDVDWSSPRLARSLENLRQEGRAVAAIVICSDPNQKSPLLRDPRVGRLVFTDLCNVYEARAL